MLCRTHHPLPIRGDGVPEAAVRVAQLELRDLVAIGLVAPTIQPDEFAKRLKRSVEIEGAGKQQPCGLHPEGDGDAMRLALTELRQ